MLLGNGDGSLQPQQTVTTGDTHADSIAIGDLNSDGWPDAVVTLYPIEAVGVFFGNGDGTLQLPRTFSVPGMGARLDVGDVDADGRLDVVVPRRDAGEVAVLSGRGDGTFEPPQSFPAPFAPASVVLADLNGDGALDVVMSNGDHERFIGVLLGIGDGTLGTPLSFPAGRGRVIAGDLDGDSNVDLVTGDDFDDEVAILLNLCPDPCRTDLNGDGVLDFLDFLAFQNLFAAGDLKADFDGSGFLNFFDFLAFQNEFAAGCP